MLKKILKGSATRLVRKVLEQSADDYLEARGAVLVISRRLSTAWQYPEVQKGLKTLQRIYDIDDDEIFDR